MIEDRLLVPAAIVTAALVLAIGIFAAGIAVRSGLRCQPVAGVPTGEPVGPGLGVVPMGAGRPDDC